MNTLRKSILIGLTVLGMGTATMAVHADEGARGHMAMHGDGARFAERVGKHLADLHGKLKLTAAQEAGWSAFAAAATPRAPAARPDRAGFAKLSAPERLEQWIARSKERLGAQENTLAALKTFYATLTPEQKKIFDDNVPGGEHGRHHHLRR